MVNVLKKNSIEPFLRFLKKRHAKSKIVLNLLRQWCLVLEIKRAQTNKTFKVSSHTFNAHLDVPWSNFIKIVFISHSI